MVQRLISEGKVEGVHFCTLNLEKSVVRVLQGLGWLPAPTAPLHPNLVQQTGHNQLIFVRLLASPNYMGKLLTYPCRILPLRRASPRPSPLSSFLPPTPPSPPLPITRTSTPTTHPRSRRPSSRRQARRRATRGTNTRTVVSPIPAHPPTESSMVTEAESRSWCFPSSCRCCSP